MQKVKKLLIVTCVTLYSFKNSKFLNFSQNAGKAPAVSEL